MENYGADYSTFESPAGQALHAFKREDTLLVNAAEPMYVSDSGAGYWHVVLPFPPLPAVATWAVCGHWPRAASGWRHTRRDARNLALHDTCRFWAAIGGRWLYVRGTDNEGWHVVAITEKPSVGREPRTLCGATHGPDPWIAATTNPATLDLHPACRAERDAADSRIYAEKRRSSWVDGDLPRPSAKRPSADGND
jgi:hypothetical protein